MFARLMVNGIQEFMGINAWAFQYEWRRRPRGDRPELNFGRYMRRKFAIAITLATVTSPSGAQNPAPPPQNMPAAEQFAMHLICRGTGERNVLSHGSALAFSGGQSAFVIGSHSQIDQFGEQMDIDINGRVAKVRVPRRFLPPAHGGSGGWFDVKDLVINPDEITGKVMINFIQHPNMRIDRRSGSVALDGKVGSFAGQCEKFDPTQHAF